MSVLNGRMCLERQIVTWTAENVLNGSADSVVSGQWCLARPRVSICVLCLGRQRVSICVLCLGRQRVSVLFGRGSLCWTAEGVGLDQQRDCLEWQRVSVSASNGRLCLERRKVSSVAESLLNGRRFVSSRVYLGRERASVLNGR
jgi:hypothetical protein